MDKKNVVFGVRREDLVFSYGKLSERFVRFASFKHEEHSHADGIRVVEAQGFDFKNELNPSVILEPVIEDIEDEVNLPADELSYHITVEDIGLKIRHHFFERPVSEVVKPERVDIPLSDFPSLGFDQGFQVRCFVSRRSTKDKKDHPAWHKSHIILERLFIAKASIDEALFDVNWYEFEDPADKEGVLYFVKWKSGEVSTVPDVDTFEVAFNAKFRDQFKRLENNKQFGHYTIRLIAQNIVSELVMHCLKNAELDTDPLEGSLHEKVKLLFDDYDLSFDEWSRRTQSDDPSAVPEIQEQVNRFTQRMYQLGSKIGEMKFGGFRAE